MVTELPLKRRFARHLPHQLEAGRFRTGRNTHGRSFGRIHGGAQPKHPLEHRLALPVYVADGAAGSKATPSPRNSLSACSANAASRNDRIKQRSAIPNLFMPLNPGENRLRRDPTAVSPKPLV
jgi:hypothetical protein